VQKICMELEEGVRPNKLYPYRVAERLKEAVRQEIVSIVMEGYAVSFLARVLGLLPLYCFHSLMALHVFVWTFTS